MTADEQARKVCEEMEARMRRMGVVTTAHYDAGHSLIAAAIRDAVAAEREACARELITLRAVVTALVPDPGQREMMMDLYASSTAPAEAPTPSAPAPGTGR